MSFQGLYDIRPMNADDENFIFSTWLRGLYYGESWFSMIPKDIFMNSYKQIVKTLLLNVNVKVNVACLKEEPNVILGYSVVSRNDEALIWIFVKKPWREQGIGKSLVPSNLKYVTHLTALGKTLLPKLNNVAFNPFY